MGAVCILRPAYLRARFDDLFPGGLFGASIAALCLQLERRSTSNAPDLNT